MDYKTLSEFADNKRKFENTVVFSALILFEIIFSFWISNVFGFHYNNQDFNWKNFIIFISSYNILIPILSIMFVFLFTRILLPIIFNLIGYYIHKKAFDTEEGFKELLKEFDIIDNNDFKHDWIYIKEYIDKSLSNEGQTNLLNQLILLFSIFITLIALIINYSFWMIIPALIILLFIILHALGYLTLRVMYLKKSILDRIINEELNK